MKVEVRLLVEVEATVLMKAVEEEVLTLEVEARVLSVVGVPIGVALAVVVVKVVVVLAAVHNLVAEEEPELEIPSEMKMMAELVQQTRRHDREM
jgi:hypothetical protein